MKKALAVLSTFAFVLIASSAFAGSAKVPKILCLDWDTAEYYHQLVFKSMGTIPTPDGAAKTYAITGHTYVDAHYPVGGNGYVVPGTTTLHATFNSQYGLMFHWLGSFELIFDLATNTGTIYYRFDSQNGTTILQGEAPVHSIDCKDPTLTIPQ